jgi:hypothetical protein
MTTQSTLERLMGDLSTADERQDEHISRIKLRISTYERMYDMRSTEMVSKVESGELVETDDICLWRMDLDLLRHVASA